MDIIAEAFRLLKEQEKQKLTEHKVKKHTLTERKNKADNESILHTIYDQVLCSLTDAGINDVNLDIPFSNSEKYASRYVLGDRNFEQDKESGIRDYARITVLKTPTIIDISKFDILSKKKDFDINDYSDEEIKNLRRTDGVSSDAPQNFDFAKKVAEYYGLDYKEYPKFIEIKIQDPFAPVMVDKIVPNRRARYAHVLAAEPQPELAMAESVLDDKDLEESVDTSLPVTFLGSDVVREYIENIPEITANRPPQSFSVGYMKELKSEIPSKYRGGRGSQDNPIVRIFKCTEYSNVFTGAGYENVGFVKRMRAETGKERSGERTGFQMGAENKIGISSTGSEQLQCYPTASCKTKVKYFLSLDDEDLREVSKEDIAEYLTPAVADRIIGRNSDNNATTDPRKPLRLKLSNIYKIGNLGRSVM